MVSVKWKDNEHLDTCKHVHNLQASLPMEYIDKAESCRSIFSGPLVSNVLSAPIFYLQLMTTGMGSKSNFCMIIDLTGLIHKKSPNRTVSGYIFDKFHFSCQIFVKLKEVLRRYDND